jgi:hypothetical protein
MPDTIRRAGSPIDPPSQGWATDFKKRDAEPLPSHDTVLQRKTQMRHEMKDITREIANLRDQMDSLLTTGTADSREWRELDAECHRLALKKSEMEAYYDNL